MKGIVLATHGKLAEGMLDAVRMFVGDPDQMVAVGLTPSEDMAHFAAAVREAVESVDTGDGVIVFCDLISGTPCNCVGALFRDEKNLERVQVITGANLPMLIEYVTSRQYGMGVEEIIQTGHDGIVSYNDFYKSWNKSADSHA